MPWYKIFCDSGPGHQSHHEFYHWEDKKLTKQDKEYLWEEAFSDRDWPIGDVILVNKLPLDYHKKMLSQIQEKIKSFKEDKKKEFSRLLARLNILRITKVGRCSHQHRGVGKPITTRAGERTLLISCPDCGAEKYYSGKWRKRKKKKEKEKQ
jgi:hypothetical protein